MSREKLQNIIHIIQSLDSETLDRYPQLETILPCLFEAIQIEDVCDHKYINGQCICGSVLTQDVD